MHQKKNPGLRQIDFNIFVNIFSTFISAFLLFNELFGFSYFLFIYQTLILNINNYFKKKFLHTQKSTKYQN